MYEIINADKFYLSRDCEIKEIPKQYTQQDKNTPICSVVITNYNYGKYLESAVQSVLNQTLKSIEVIIVDDGSTDYKSREIVQSFIGLAKVKVILQENQGVSAARNNGISEARGKYICAMDADDLFLPSYLEQCVFELESHDNLGFVYSWVRFFGDENFTWQTQNFNIDVALRENLTCGAAVFQKTDWALVNGYSLGMHKGFEDWEFWLKLAQVGRCGKVIPAPLFLYRRHGVTRGYNAESVRNSLKNDIRTLNNHLYEDTMWKNTVKKYSTVISPSHYPFHLSSVNKRNSISNNESILVILPWDNCTKTEVDCLQLINAICSQYNIYFLTTTYNIFPFINLLADNAQEVLHYANSAISDEDHFYYFLRYLIDTRNINIILNVESEKFYDSIQKIATSFNELIIFDLLYNLNSPILNKSIQLSNYIARYICLNDDVKNKLADYRINSEKIFSLDFSITS